MSGRVRPETATMHRSGVYRPVREMNHVRHGVS